MDLIKQARREAVKCLKQAAEEAERLRSQAISEGFQQGVLASVDAATRQLASCPDYGTKARRLSEQGLQALSDRLMRHFAGEHALPIIEP